MVVADVQALMLKFGIYTNHGDYMFDMYQPCFFSWAIILKLHAQ